ncbi:RNA-splicing ligase RtcB-like protein 2 [Entamoeba marina]
MKKYTHGKKRDVKPIGNVEKETTLFHGSKIPLEAAPYLERLSSSLLIKKGFVEGMSSDAEIYCNDELFQLLLTELMNESLQSTFLSCIRQTANVATLPGVVKSLAMPDAHSGYGFSIGGVAAMRLDNKEAVICPGGVGFDINCGVRLLRTNLKKEDVIAKQEELANKLQNTVPSGVGTSSGLSLGEKEMVEVLNHGLEWLCDKGYAWKDDLIYCEEGGKIENAKASLVSTLGSGNHYLEVQVVDEILDIEAAKTMGIHDVGQVCVMIHCGSRGLGHQVCQDYVNKYLKDQSNAIDKQLTGVPFGSELGQQYFSAMNAAANFAFANQTLFSDVFGKPATELDMNLVYDVCHNIAKVEEHQIDGSLVKCLVHRKGATRAFPPQHPMTPLAYKNIGQPAIIGGSMGTHSYVLVGTDNGMKQSFGSTCHGAGRKLSRVKALTTIESSDKKGIVLKISDPKLAAEEADEAYKSVTDVVETCANSGISKIVVRLKPLIVVKG